MNMRLFWVLLIGLLPALVLVGVRAIHTADGVEQGPGGPADGQPVSVTMHASWVGMFGSLEEGASKATLVVRGRVLGAPPPVAETMSDGAGRELVKYVLTFHRIHIEEVLAGSLSEDEIVVAQTGGLHRGVLVEVDDDPLFDLGQEYIFFLMPGGTGVYTTLGGPVGRLVVNGGRVSSLSAAYPARSIPDLGLVLT